MRVMRSGGNNYGKKTSTLWLASRLVFIILCVRPSNVRNLVRVIH
jgi:hypothetical protein